MTKLTREELLRRTIGTAAAASLAPLAAACGGNGGGEGARTGTEPTATQEGPTEALKIGFFNAFTGPLAQGGLDCRTGWDLYLESTGNRLNDRQVEVVYEDDEGDPAVSLTKARQLHLQDEVEILVGGISAASGPPVFEYVNSVGIPWINPLIATDELTQRLENNFMVRVGGTASQMSHYFAEWLRENQPDITNVAAIGWDFLFGYQNVSGFQDVFEELGGAVVQKTWIPPGTPDHSPFLSRIDTSVDAVYAVFGSSDAARFMNSYLQFGLKDRLPLMGNWTLTDETVLATGGLPAEASLDVLTDGRYNGINDNPENRRLQEIHNQAHEIGSASNNVCDGWVAAQAIEAALEKVGNDTTDREKFAAAFKGIELATPRGPVAIDDNLNPVQNVYVRRVDRVDDSANLPPGYSLELQNTILATIPEGNQFWKFDVEEYLSQPPYSRDFPPVSQKQ